MRGRGWVSEGEGQRVSDSRCEGEGGWVGEGG